MHLQVSKHMKLQKICSPRMTKKLELFHISSLSITCLDTIISIRLVGEPSCLDNPYEPLGVFQLLRLPFSVCSAQAIKPFCTLSFAQLSQKKGSSVKSAVTCTAQEIAGPFQSMARGAKKRDIADWENSTLKGLHIAQSRVKIFQSL